ncbi:transcription termination/antitermination protein NusA [Candidatus Azambacteria bacterium]|nr:transcription termination/antitermination protein NusA [Candidatus Azambacteria bacterium]
MIDTKQFLSAINQIAEEKGISKEKIIETIEMAIAAAYKKDYGERGQIVRAKLEPETGAVTMHQVKIVVDESMLRTPEEVAQEEAGEAKEHQENVEGAVKKITFNAERHIMLEDAKAIKPEAVLEDEITFPLEAHEDFGRIAAQTAKQVIIQRLREAEREMVLSEYKSREGEVANAQVQRFEWKNVIFDLGKTSAIMYPEEQIPQERYRIGERMKVYIVKVDMTPKGPMVVVSRSHPLLIQKLFELEVPEVASGVVQLKAIAREAGSRSKIAVSTIQDSVDPIGSCVGQKGTRVSTVISELGGEKIDIIEWSSDPEKLIANALSPAKVISVSTNLETRESVAVVPNDQLSLAIGKGGQNVRLAARLSGWKIDVKPAVEEAVPSDEKEGGAADEEAGAENAGGEKAGDAESAVAPENE